ncbi:MAG TPA: hypothetical protein VHL11_09600 [Phototrophicaceae bacterium]|nr:hypothetical protein [Phototrophicaceae bacterium]
MTFKFVFMPRFDRSVKQLQKRFPHINADIAAALTLIEDNPQSGDVIPHDFNIRKLRVASKDMQRGKSGGFRLLYKLITKEEDLIANLLFIYAKADQEDVSSDLLEQLSDEVDE